MAHDFTVAFLLNGIMRCLSLEFRQLLSNQGQFTYIAYIAWAFAFQTL